jgi:hypothetical protein
MNVIMAYLQCGCNLNEANVFTNCNHQFRNIVWSYLCECVCNVQCFFLGWMIALWWQKNPMWIVKWVFWAKLTKVIVFLGGKSHLTLFRQNEFLLVARTRPIFFINYFVIWLLAKFGSLLLKMIANPPTWQFWKNPCDSNILNLF